MDLGALQGNRGDQQHQAPGDVDLTRYPNAVVWRRAFAVGFTSASLAAAGEAVKQPPCRAGHAEQLSQLLSVIFRAL